MAEVLRDLDTRLATVLVAVYESDAWRTVTSPDSPLPLVLATLREIMWSIAQYQPWTTEAGFRMLGRLPKDEAKLLMSLVRHKAEEAEHSEWARRDFLRLGGRPEQLAGPLSPATFAVVAVWDRLSSSEDPVAYLGAEYLFECLTMQVTPLVMAALTARGVARDAVGFIADHVEEDVKHTKLLTHWIEDITTRQPESGTAMLRAFDHFANVYPVPVWNEALTRAQCHSDGSR